LSRKKNPISRRRNVKKVIELLEDALDVMLHVTKIPTHYQEVDYIKEAITLLETPRYLTPERWEAETGEPWPDNGAVYFWNGCAGWTIMHYRRWKEMIIKLGEEGGYERLPEKETQYPAVCATEAGPPDGWRPEGHNADTPGE
jgi:hypothetical protein